MNENVPHLIAHRGASFDAPENTPAAFELAWEQGADGIECDVRLTADGEIAVIHDPTTLRTAGVDLVVSDTTFADLAGLDIGSWKGTQWAGQRIVRLVDLLPSVPPAKHLFIEVKCGVEIVPALAAPIADFDPNRLAVISYDRDVVTQIKQAVPPITTYLIIRYRPAPAGLWLPSADEIITTLRQTHADGLATHANSLAVTQVFSESVLAAVPLLNVWPINDPADALHFIRLGATSLTTDRPAFLRETMTRP